MEILDKSGFKNKVFDFEANKDWSFKGTRPAIVDFYADWCGPCKALAPIMDDLSREYAGKIDIYKVDTDKDPELAAMFGVRGIPALLFIPKNGPPAMAGGFMPKEELKEAIEKVLGVK